MELTRRDLLRSGVGAGVALAASGSVVPALADPLPRGTRRPPYVTGFTSLTDEIDLPDVPVDGRLPGWLSGVLLRNGPALFEIGDQKLNHWFDGLAMLHAFSFANGRVAYRNRFLRSSAYRAWKRDGVMEFSEFGTDPDPCRVMFREQTTLPVLGRIPNANVSIEALANRFQALTELPVPVRFGGRSLRTLSDGAEMPNGRMSTAHPHHDPRTGERFSYEIELVPPSGLRIVSERRGVRRELAFIPRDRPGYLHSFALTRRWVAVHTQPWEFDLARFLSPDRGPIATNFVWDGAKPSQIILIDRMRGGVAATVELETAFVFHNINAFDDGEEVVLDVCAHRDSGIVDAMYLKNMKKGGRVPQARVQRLTVDPARSRVRTRELCEGNFELPRIDYAAANGRPYRYAYGVGVCNPTTGSFLDRLGKLDVKREDQRHWHEKGAYPGEPIFVRRPGGRREDDGVLLSVVLDGRRKTSYLLVLDARDMSEIARAAVPHHIPFGFHGLHAGRR
jgi:carotenoid cleavage dioxygenase-like enzyme